MALVPVHVDIPPASTGPDTAFDLPIKVMSPPVVTSEVVPAIRFPKLIPAVDADPPTAVPRTMIVPVPLLPKVETVTSSISAPIQPLA